MEIKPLVPFEPVSTEAFPKGEEWISQVKWDGVRLLTYYNGYQVRLFNRKLNERTSQYPELTEINKYCKANSVILDGEVIALDNGKPSFHKVMKRDSIRRLERVEIAKQRVPISYMVFDILYLNGQWLNNLSLAERQEILKKQLIPSEQIHLVDNFSDSQSLFTAVKEQGLEGIVCKKISSTYAIGGKDDRWRKIKNYHDLLAVIGGVTLRNGVINALLLGIYDEENKLWYIGHAGTGKLTDKDWQELTTLIKPLKIKDSPFINKVQRVKDAIWCKPEYVVKVQFIDWTSGGTLRQPSIQAFIDANPFECRLYKGGKIYVPGIND